MNRNKIALSLLLTFSMVALNAKWFNTSEIKEDVDKGIDKGWQAVKDASEKIQTAFKKKKFQIEDNRSVTLEVENSEKQLVVKIDGVSEDILDVSHQGGMLVVTIRKK